MSDFEYLWRELRQAPAWFYTFNLGLFVAITIGIVFLRVFLRIMLPVSENNRRLEERLVVLEKESISRTSTIKEAVKAVEMSLRVSEEIHNKVKGLKFSPSTTVPCGEDGPVLPGTERPYRCPSGVVG